MTVNHRVLGSIPRVGASLNFYSSMERQYAYIQIVENKKKKTSANEKYFQLVTQNNKVYFFTEKEIERAEKRASKNPEDQKLVEVNYEVIIDS